MSADLNANRPRVEVIGVPLDLGAGLRGVDVGPSAVRHAGLVARLRDLGYEVADLGNVSTPISESVSVGQPTRRYAAAVDDVCFAVRNQVASAIGRGALPLLLGGDHSLAAGSLAGLLDRRPDTRVLWLDAHGDLNTPATSPSGNVHGMPLAAALGLADDLFPSLGWSKRSLRPDQIALVGIRSLDRGERDVVARLGIRVYTIADIDRQGMFQIMESALGYLDASRGNLHVSLDLDVIDPASAPGVGTAVAGGMTLREAHLAMELIARSGSLGSLEAVEVNALRDHENQTGRLASDLILSALGQTIL